MFPAGVLKSRLLGGFRKKDADAYFMHLVEQIQVLERLQGISPVTEFQPERLKSVSFGTGYDKESVLRYIDELQGHLVSLEHQS